MHEMQSLDPLRMAAGSAYSDSAVTTHVRSIVRRVMNRTPPGMITAPPLLGIGCSSFDVIN